VYFARTAQKLREQMVRFSGELSSGLPKVTRRLVAEMVFGIQARGPVRLTEVGRALGERISLKKTEERLPRQLGRKRLDREIQCRLIEHAAPRIKDDTLLVLDLSDVIKKYVEKMEHLAWVRDGSEKELGWGYWTLNISGRTRKGRRSSLSTDGCFFTCGGGPSERERGDPRGGRGGVGRSEEAGHMGHGPGRG